MLGLYAIHSLGLRVIVSSLEKLLLGVIWKTGYKKESHIIRGILSEDFQKENAKNEVNNSYVFWKIFCK